MKQLILFMILVAACLVVDRSIEMTSRAFADELSVAPSVLEAEQSRIAAIAKAKQAAVAVFDAEAKGGGSGIVVTPDGYALTNYHVVKPCGSFMRCGMSDGRLYDAVIVGIDPTGDVAMIKLLGRDDFPVADIGDSDTVRVGHWCFAIGNPFLLATDFQPTVTYGIVSGVHRYQYPAGTLLEYADCLQTDAAINPGNSGGPLFNAAGQLIGINGRGSFEKRGRVNVGVGYAISINQIKHFMGYLRSGRIVDHATLGATVSSGEDGRVIVSNILQSCDAYRRGLRYNDEIISFGGRAIDSTNDFKNVLGIFPKGWRVPIEFQRDDQRFSTYVRLTGVHASDDLFNKIQGEPESAEEDPKKKDQPDEKPAPKKPGKEEKPPGHADQQSVEIPAAAAALIEDRRGFANYYFNRLNRTRIWENWSARLNREKLAKNWKLIGTLDDGGKIEIVIGDEMAGGQFPEGAEMVDLQLDPEDQLFPDNSGGLLLALNMWRRFIVVGPEKYGDVYYLGTAPLPVTGQQHDVLVATRGVIETRTYFDEINNMPAAMEMYPDVETDPCELYFDDYRQVEDSLMPFSIDVVYGDKQFARIKVERYEFVEPKEIRE